MDRKDVIETKLTELDNRLWKNDEILPLDSFTKYFILI